MGFLPDYDREGPGVPPDAPRKQGFPRLMELLGRDLWDIFRAGFLAALGCAPFLFGLFFAIVNQASLLALAFGLIGGLIAGPELCGFADTVLRALRDEPGFWWHIYKRSWRRNAKAALLPGAAGGALLAAQTLLLVHSGTLGFSPAMAALLTAGILITLGLSLYVWPQLALMELPFGQMLRNAALLFIGQLPRSLGALAITAAYWGVVLWFFPLAVNLLPFTNFWLPGLPALMLIYPGIEKNFRIEEKIRRKQAEET